jgi:hypothetical protein
MEIFRRNDWAGEIDLGGDIIRIFTSLRNAEGTEGVVTTEAQLSMN